MIGIVKFCRTITPFIFFIWILLQFVVVFDIFLNKGKFLLKLIDLFGSFKKGYKSEHEKNLHNN